MVNVQAVLSLVLPFTQIPLEDSHAQHANAEKSIAIVGAGSAGLAMLKTLLDFPLDKRQGWDIVLYEEREDVGGVWLPEPDPPTPPELPETPLYPLLRTNTPVPTMTYPGFPFPPMTPLFPRHPHVEKYLRSYADHFNLWPFIQLKHSVTRASWDGTSERGHWELTVKDPGGQSVRKSVDHLVVATGNIRYPHIPQFDGEELWLRGDPKREILHSVWYRGPERYTNKTVLVVGGGASGKDAAEQISGIARETYWSLRSDAPPVEGTILKPEISHFTEQSVVFVDGTALSDIDAVILGTGYDLRKPFLESGKAVKVDPGAHTNASQSHGLVDNLRYLFPLHRHILSLCDSHPPNALAFIGLPSAVANCPSDIAQSLFTAHAIADPKILPSRAALQAELAQHEADLRAHGWDPYWIGHRLVDDTEFEYQNELIRYLKAKGAIPDDGREYVERWREKAREYGYPQLKRGWLRIEEQGDTRRWLEGVKSEREWAQLMRRVHVWQKRWEDEHGLAFTEEDMFQY